MLELVDVTKEYATRAGRLRVLDNVSVRLEKGQRLAVLGKPGSGKSALIRILSGVEPPTAGRLVRDMSVSWPIGTSSSLLQPNLSGLENIRFISRIYGQPLQETAAFVEDFAEVSRLRDLVSTYPRKIKAQISFALSLAIEFDCYLIDEKVEMGEKHFRDKCEQAIEDRWAGKAIFMVSSNAELVRPYCSEVMFLEAGKLSDRLPIARGSGWRRRLRQIEGVSKATGRARRRRLAGREET